MSNLRNLSTSSSDNVDEHNLDDLDEYDFDLDEDDDDYDTDYEYDLGYEDLYDSDGELDHNVVYQMEKDGMI